MSFSLILTLTLLTLTTSSQAASVINITERSNNCPIMLPMSNQDRIVGGDLGDPYLRTHLVSFHWEGCGGSVISKRWGITAAHCVIAEDAVPTIGGKRSQNGVQIRIKKLHRHPQYEFPLNDIMLIEFDQDVPEGTNFVYVNADDSIPEIGEYARSAGWGHTGELQNPNSEENLLYQVDVPVVTTEICVERIMRYSPSLAEDINTNMHICAGYEKGQCDSCKADSGGPLVVYDEEDKLVQVGIVSFGVGCARVGVPGGYLRLSTHVDWMKSVGAEFTVKSTRKPVYLKDIEGDVGEPPSPPGDEPTKPAPSPDSGSGMPSPVSPPAPSSAPTGTNAPSTSSPSPSDEGSETVTDPQPPPIGAGVSGTGAPSTTTFGPAAPPTTEPDNEEGSSAEQEESGSGTSSTSGSNPSEANDGGEGTGSTGEIVPDASDEPSATAGPEIAGNSGSAIAGGNPGGGGVSAGVAIGSSIGVLVLASAIFVLVLMRRRAAARLGIAGTSDTSNAAAPTMASEAGGGEDVASGV